MYMRDLAYCAEGTAFYATPSDLAPAGLATRTGRVDGTLAGGTVMSLTAGRDGAIVVAVTSNIAYANTSALARRITEAFAGRQR